MYDTAISELAKFAMLDHNVDIMAIKAEDITSRRSPVFKMDIDITEAAKQLVKSGETGRAVLDANGTLVGFISESRV